MGIQQSASSRGLGGLLSGIDTDSMVKGMTANIRIRIARQMQARQKVMWRIDAYRNITTKMNELNNKFLTFSSATNALSRAFYNTTSSVATGANAGAVTVTGSSAAAKDLSITDIVSYATTASFITTKDASPNKITTGEINFDVKNNLADQSFQIKVNENTYRIRFDDDFDGQTNDEIAQYIQDKLSGISAEGGNLGQLVEVNITGNTFTIDLLNSSDTLELVDGTGRTLSILGLETDGNTIKGSPNTGFSFPGANPPVHGVLSSPMQDAGNANSSITFNLNGTSRVVYMPKYEPKNDGSDLAEYADLLQQEINKTFGENRILVEIDGNALSFKTVRKEGASVVDDTTSTLTITNASAMLTGSDGALGIEIGASNRLSLGQKLSGIASLDYKTITYTEPSGETTTVEGFKIEINGKEVILDKEMTLSEAIDTINRAEAGLKIAYMPTTGKFSVTAAESGENGKVNINDIADGSGGNFVSALFGSPGNIDPSVLQTEIDALNDEISGAGGLNDQIDAKNLDIDDYETGTLDAHKTLMEAKNDEITAKEDEIDSLAKIINDAETLPGYINNELNPIITELAEKVRDLNTQIGSMDPTDPGYDDLIAERADVSAQLAEMREVREQARADLDAARAALDDDGNGYNAADLNRAKDNLAAMNSDLETLEDEYGIMEENLAALNEVHAGLIDERTALENDKAVKTNEINHKQNLINDFNDGKTFAAVQGQDAEIKIKYGNGEEQVVKRSSNHFNIDGMSITLNPDVKFDKDAGPITFMSKTNTDNVINNINSLITMYNEIVDLVNISLRTKPNNNYQPLTDEQKAGMSETQIRDWEERAKAGLLYNDSTLFSLSNELRFIFSSNAFRNIGITGDLFSETYGKIQLIEGDRLEKLKTALEENPDMVEDLFVGQNGAIHNLKNVVDKYSSTMNQNRDANSTTIFRGILVEKAGLLNHSTMTDNMLYRQVESINKTIERLLATQRRQEDRYYRQFTALEKHMARMGEQSAWMQQQLGTQY